MIEAQILRGGGAPSGGGGAEPGLRAAVAAAPDPAAAAAAAGSGGGGSNAGRASRTLAATFIWSSLIDLSISVRLFFPPDWSVKATAAWLAPLDARLLRRAPPRWRRAAVPSLGGRLGRWSWSPAKEWTCS